MTKFIFDLDGTITKEETLPLIARHFKVEEKIEELTRATVAAVAVADYVVFEEKELCVLLRQLCKC